MSEHDPLMTFAQLAKAEGLKEKAIRDLKRGHPDFPAINIGTGSRPSYKIYRSAFRAWLNARSTVRPRSAGR